MSNTDVVAVQPGPPEAADDFKKIELEGK